MVDAALVRSLFSYDQATGDLIRLTAPTYKNKVGDVAGYICKSSGYRKIKVKQYGYPAHRLVWLHVHGCWPAHEIDHINGDKTDNRLSNLRDVTHQVNVQNLRESTSSSSTGMLGVGPHGDRWRARILHEGRTRYLGRYKTKELAQEAYVKAKREIHEGCTL